MAVRRERPAPAPLGLRLLAVAAGEMLAGRSRNARASLIAMQQSTRRSWATACAQLQQQHLLWWEAVVLVRKAGIVLLAVLVTNPYFQTGGAIVWLGAASHLQLWCQPYANPFYNGLESLALMSSVLTAAVSGTLLQYDVSDPSFATQPPEDMTPQEWAITLVLIIINLTTLSILGGTWVWLQFRALRSTAKDLRARVQRTRSAGSLQPAMVDAESSTAPPVAATADHQHKARSRPLVSFAPMQAAVASPTEVVVNPLQRTGTVRWSACEVAAANATGAPVPAKSTSRVPDAYDASLVRDADMFKAALVRSARPRDRNVPM